jgi:hypothetical protein
MVRYCKHAAVGGILLSLAAPALAGPVCKAVSNNPRGIFAADRASFPDAIGGFEFTSKGLELESRQMPIYKPADSPTRSNDISPQQHSTLGASVTKLVNGAIELRRNADGSGMILTRGRQNGTNRGDAYAFIVRSQRPAPKLPDGSIHDIYFTDTNVQVDSRAKTMRFHFPNVKAYDESIEGPVRYDEMLRPLTIGSDGDIRLVRTLAEQDVTRTCRRAICTDTYTSRTLPSFTVLPSGRVGVNTAAPAAELDVNGDLRLATYSGAPATCDADRDGALALNSRQELCACNQGAWIVANTTTACAW